MGQTIGLNGAEASSALSSIEEQYNGIMQEINALQSSALEKIKASWIGEDATDFANNKFIPAIKDAGNEIQKVFQSVNDTITQNAQNYERKHNVNVFKKVSHIPRPVNLTPIPRPTGDFIGIKDISGLTETTTGLRKMASKIGELLARAKQAAGRSGFYGENQQEKLTASMGKIKQSLEDLAKQLEDAVKKKMQAVEEEEKSIAQQNASTM